METKVSDVLSTSIIHNLGFYHLISVPPMGTKGGILCAWRASLSPNVISTSILLTMTSDFSARAFMSLFTKPYVLNPGIP